MIQRQVDRRAPTRGGMIISVGLHATFVLLLAIMVGRQASQIEVREELVEIAYIEARYGEDVAAKVRMKAVPIPSKEPGPGVSTRSAVQPPEASPEPESPEPPAAQSRPQVAEAAAPQLEAPPQTTLPPAATLESKALRKSSAPIVELDQIEDPKLLAEVSSPNAKRSTSPERFRPQEAELSSRNRTALDPGADAVVGKIRSGGPAIAAAEDKADKLLSGGGLESRGGGYSAPTAGLTAAGGANRIGRGVADTDGPAGGGSPGGGESRGRRTVLDYGTGGGGGGGGLVGRGVKLVEAPRAESIVENSDAHDTKAVEEGGDTLAADGVSMRISGQIAGRQILSSVAPVYSDQARRNGWEGVVVMHFTVLPDGRVKDNAYFEQTSAHRDLNRAAMDAIRQYRFAPLPAGEVVEQWGLISIVFRLS